MNQRVDHLESGTFATMAAPGLARADSEAAAARAASRRGRPAERWHLPASPFPMWIYDRASGRIVAANGAAARAYRCPRDELLESNVRDICLLEDPSRAMQTAPRADLSPWVGTVTQRRKDGSTFVADISMIETGDLENAATMVLVHSMPEERWGAGRLPLEGGAMAQKRAKKRVGS